MPGSITMSPSGSKAEIRGPHRFAGQIPELDGFRGIAILMVLAYHLFHYSMRSRSWTGLPHLVSSATMRGWWGVDLFFALSGFLITGILLDTRTDSKFFRNFYARRALRILPLYYFVLLVMLLCYSHSGAFVLLSFFYLSNIAPILHIMMVNGALWSLAVEEHFYLVWPLIVRLLRFSSIVCVAVTICVAEPVIRGICHAVYGSNVYAYTWFRLDGLAFGALMACFVRSARYTTRRAVVVSTALVFSGVMAQIVFAPLGIQLRNTNFGAAFLFTSLNVVFSGAVLYGAALSGSWQTSLLRSSFLRVTADLSYCLYIIHFLVIDAYDAVFKAFHVSATSDFRSIVLRAGVVAALCFGLAAVSRQVLEGPALRLKRYFEPRIAESSPAPAASTAGGESGLRSVAPAT